MRTQGNSPQPNPTHNMISNEVSAHHNFLRLADIEHIDKKTSRFLKTVTLTILLKD
jgi:hypothetical protein